jgi:hypothetical protein
MEPNKFEENIRTKFEERELRPSAEAWSKLEAQLGTPKSSNNTRWYAIAASLVALLVVGSFLLKGEETVSNEIVEQTIPAETINEIEVATSEENKVNENTIAKDADEAELKKEGMLSKKEQQSIADNTGNTLEKRDETVPNRKGAFGREKENITTGNTETTVAQVDKTNREEEVLKAIEKEAFIQLKIDEVVAQVGGLQNNTTTVTAEDVEVLLQQAQRDITNQRLLNQSTTTIDPASLLNDVETELERGFRDKVFDALGEGFNKIRTAVVERNN